MAWGRNRRRMYAPQLVSLFLRATAKPHEAEEGGKAATLVNQLTKATAKDYGRDQNCILSKFGFPLVFDGVTRSHMRNFMRHYACELRFVVRRQQQTLVYIEETTRQSEGVYLV